MGKFILTDARLFAHGADLSGASNKIEVSAEVEEKESTNYRSGGYKEVLGGLRSSSFSAEGHWEAADMSKVDNSTWTNMGTKGPWTACPTDSTVGAVAWFTAALTSSYKLGDAVGEIAPYTAQGKGSWALVRGQMVHSPGAPRTTSGSAAGIQLVGGVPAGKRLYAALHVLSVAGIGTPAVTVTIESDDASGFASPATQLSFTSATSRSGQILRTDGTANTDEWYRVSWNIAGGTSPSFLFAVALGIA